MLLLTPQLKTSCAVSSNRNISAADMKEKCCKGYKRMIISERIFELLQEKGMSQKEFSEKTGISQSTISDWKRKKTNPSADKLKVICDVLHITLYDLLGESDQGSRQSVDYIIVDKQSDDYFLLEEYHTLSKMYKERLLGYLRALKDIGEITD